jgi:serine/threonine-protein kinase RsbT
VNDDAIDVQASEQLEIDSDGDVVRVRQATRTLATRASLSLVEQTKVVTAASELARNTLVHGGGGVARLELVVQANQRTGVRAVFSDKGPGIPDVQLALTEGYTSGTGLGLGLSGSRRLVDQFDLRTEVGAGTEVTIVKWGR